MDAEKGQQVELFRRAKAAQRSQVAVDLGSAWWSKPFGRILEVANSGKAGEADFCRRQASADSRTGSSRLWTSTRVPANSALSRESSFACGCDTPWLDVFRAVK